MAPSLWEDIKKTVKEGVSIAAEKTEEYTKIGKLKVDILNINRSIEKTHAELGREVYSIVTKNKNAEINNNTTIQKLIKSIKDHNVAVASKEKEIEKIKKHTTSQPVKETPTKQEEAKTIKTQPKTVKKPAVKKTVPKTTKSDQK